MDQDRFEQELVFYLEKMDITEEKVRLRAHCTYFSETPEAESSKGASSASSPRRWAARSTRSARKANDARHPATWCCMKDELEKIKEQVLNVLA